MRPRLGDCRRAVAATQHAGLAVFVLLLAEHISFFIARHLSNDGLLMTMLPAGDTRCGATFRALPMAGHVLLNAPRTRRAARRHSCEWCAVFSAGERREPRPSEDRG